MWYWPLENWNLDKIPEGDHNGAFGKKRKYDTHTGVDLYCNHGTKVYAVEEGTIVGIETFTGPEADSPWWNSTKAILVEGKSGVVLYGEIYPYMIAEGLYMPRVPYLKVGNGIYAKDFIGNVVPVLKKDKGNPMCMLHLELYKHGTTKSEWWHKERPKNLLDPTEYLKKAFRHKNIISISF